MKVLITGAFGNLGLKCVEQALEFGFKVRCFDLNTPLNRKLYNDFKSFFAQYDIRRNKDFVSTFPGPLAEWFKSLEADVPSEDDIRQKRFVLESTDRTGDPATTEEYGGGDDEHEAK